MTEGIGVTKPFFGAGQINLRGAMIQSDVRRTEENTRQARAVEMGAQGMDHMENIRQEFNMGSLLEI